MVNFHPGLGNLLVIMVVVEYLNVPRLYSLTMKLAAMEVLWNGMWTFLTEECIA